MATHNTPRVQSEISVPEILWESSSNVARCKHRKLHELENLQLHGSNLLPAKQIMFAQQLTGATL